MEIKPVLEFTVKVWNMTEGEITELKYNDQFFVLKTNNPSDYGKLMEKPPFVFKQKNPTIAKPNNPTTPPTVDKSPKKKYTRNVKTPYVTKWIQKNNFDVFTIDMFFKEHPVQRRSRRINSHLSDLCTKKMLTQIGKTKFRVNRTRW